MKSMDPAKRALALSLISESIRLCEEMGHDLTACQLQLALDRLIDAPDSPPIKSLRDSLQDLNRDRQSDEVLLGTEKAIRRP